MTEKYQMLNSSFGRPISNTRRTLLLCLALLLTAVGPAAVHAQQVRSITFDEAVRIALERNVNLRIAANNVEMQATDVSQSRSNFLPNLNLSMSPSQSYGLQFDQTAGRLVQEQAQSMGATISANVNLFNGFGDVANLRQAEAAYEASDLRFERTQHNVVFEVVSRFLEVVENREQISIREENLESQQRQLARIEEFTRVGARPISELYQQQANVASSELELLNAERAYQISTSRLIQVLELDPFGEYRFIAPSVDEVTFTEQTYDLEQLLRTAFESRPDIGAQRSQIIASEEGIRAAGASRWPTLSLSGNLRSNYTSLRDPSFEDQFFRDNRGAGFGLNLSIPIFDRFTTRNSVQRARIQADNARLDLQSLQQNVALEVRQAYLDYQTALKQLDVTEKQLRASDMALQAEQERYNVGASTLVELTQVRAQYVQAASARTSAVYNFLFQGRVIDYYLGRIDPTQSVFE